MSRRAVMQMSRLLVGQSRQQLFSTAIFNTASNATTNGTFRNSIPKFASNEFLGVRCWSSTGPKVATHEELTQEPKANSGEENTDRQGGSRAVVSSYWGVAPPNIAGEDGSPWRWNCFRPWETYKADTSIDVKKHHEANTIMDKFAFWTVQTLKYPTYLFFQRRHVCHAMLLETVAAVPGMVGGMLLHLRSLRKFEHSGGWIKALLEEAENERMHLMTFLEVSQPKWYERALVFAVQGVFFNAYFLAYLASPKLAHRIVGYLEEEAVNSYTEFLVDLEKGLVENGPAPAIAIDYWRLAPNATKSSFSN
ncbi:Ubiquinol oxidase 3- mitochondrial [Striga hermonthica]|uniref:Ubiquinol oxidase n=1 Tax=Striga hermonthica TaxID=68872 RepID=A0A9N7RNG2_STRHE|nr:Ubiquinol oxidase 3- mitochondrial [Striga hermonthica]